MPSLVLVICAFWVSAQCAIHAQLPPLAPIKKEKKQKLEVTQTLELLADPPAALLVETNKLSMQTAPLSSKGLLSQQVRDGIRSLWKLHRDARIVQIRAFVAGSGDLRRVQTVLSEEFAHRHLPLPVLSVVQIGDLPLVDAQLAMESTAVEKKDVNPAGLLFLSSQRAVDPDVTKPVGPLLTTSLQRLQAAATEAGASAEGVLRATCYVSSLEGVEAQAIRKAFPQAAAQLLQSLRAPSQAFADCEAVARLSAADGQPVQSHKGSVSVRAPKLVLSGAQLGFGQREGEIRQVVDRLQKPLQANGSALAHVVVLRTYASNGSPWQQIGSAVTTSGNAADRRATLSLACEGLPSLDAGFAVDAIAVVP